MLPDAEFHPAVAAALRLIDAPTRHCTDWPVHILTVHAYTDGSVSLADDGALLFGWGVALIGEDAAGRYVLLGWFGASQYIDLGMLPSDRSPNNNDAEVLAIAWTLLWALAAREPFELQVHSDSMYALAAADAGPAAQHPSLLEQCLAPCWHCGRGQAPPAHRPAARARTRLAAVERARRRSGQNGGHLATSA